MVPKKSLRKPWKRNGRFYNYESEKPHSFLVPLIGMMIRSWFLRTRTVTAPPCGAPVIDRVQEPTITWIGHSTFLIQFESCNILTDPIFGRPSILFGRNGPPGIALADLPPIDLLLISHNHWDHLHEQTLLALQPLLRKHGGKILVPSGDRAWFDARGFDDVQEFLWAEQYSGSAGVTVTFLPAHHWSRRGVFDRNRSLWGSWMIEADGYTVYFAGDTAYGPHFSEIGEQFSIDCALLPIGPCEPHHIMQHSHTNAAQAGQAFLDLKAKRLIPMHWATFNFGLDDRELPARLLREWWCNNKERLGDLDLSILAIGEQFVAKAPGSLRNKTLWSDTRGLNHQAP